MTRGFTITELMVSAAILALLVLSVAPMIRLSTKGLSNMESSTTLRVTGQRSMNFVSELLTESKRQFENSAADIAFVNKISLASDPPALTGSRLATIEELGSLTPNSTAFVPASVGNSLMFASLGAASDLTVLNSLGASSSVRIDTFRFNYFYISLDNSKSIGNVPRRDLRFWQSVVYADHYQISSITDSTKKSNAVAALRNAGTLYAWDPTATSATSAFYILNANGTMTLSAGHKIQKYRSESLIGMLTGISGYSFRYGISPNSSAGISTQDIVPEFGVESGLFPSGLEIVSVGPSSSRQIFVRMVLMTQAAGGIQSSEQVLLTSVRDLW